MMIFLLISIFPRFAALPLVPVVSPPGASDPSPLPPLHPTMLLPNPRGLDSHSLATAMALHPAGNAAGPVAAADPTGSPRQVREGKRGVSDN